MTNFWLVLALVSLVLAIYVVVRDGWHGGSMYFVFPLLAGMMYGVRKFMLSRMDRHNRREN